MKPIIVMSSVVKEEVLARCPTAVCLRTHDGTRWRYTVYRKRGGGVLVAANNAMRAWFLARKILVEGSQS